MHMGCTGHDADEWRPAVLGDIFQYRLALGHFLDESKSSAYAIEVLDLPQEHWFTASIVASAGVLFTVAGQYDIAAIHPDFSVCFHWSHTGREPAR